MKSRRTGVLVGIVSTVLVLLLALADVGRKSPGPVSRVHGRVESIANGNACSTCHGGWFGDMRSSCTECHEDIAMQVAQRRGLHGTLSPALAASCGSCHGEHHGEQFRLVNRLAWSQAGVPDPQQFDHQRIGFAMAGAHVRLACTKCHVNADADELPDGGERFLGLQQACGTCHQDPHGGRMKVACAVCHSQDTFLEPDVPEHDRWLRLDGAHAAVGCRVCHAAETPHALETLVTGASQHARACGDCHESPHSRQFLTGNAAILQIPPAASCASCHPLDYATFGDPRAMVDPAQHAHGGFSLRAPHDRLACIQCHAPGRSFAERHPGRAQHDCHACHADPHGGQFARGPFAEQGCGGCHAPTHFGPHGFDLDHHEKTALPLHGKHAEAACNVCHLDPVPGEPRMFAGTPHRCEQCHADVHQPVFARSDAELAANPRGTCAECHGTQAFAHVDHAAFAHEHHTGFSVTAAHAQIGCDDCHVRSEQPDARGRRFGRIARTGERFLGCVTCHQDVHQGVFDREDLPAEVGGRTGCERCHDTASFRALPFEFDHGAATGFALTGEHGQLECAKCHPRLSGPDPLGRTWQRAAGRDCANCHQDPHGGQFDVAGRSDCAKCHRSATSFAALSFRHNLDSKFPLSEAHAQVPCAGCHRQENIGGRWAVRYKPLPTDCVQCHGTDEAPLRRRKA